MQLPKSFSKPEGLILLWNYIESRLLLTLHKKKMSLIERKQTSFSGLVQLVGSGQISRSER